VVLVLVSFSAATLIGATGTSYMEVAVNHSFLKIAGICFSIAALTGCAEQMTYSRDFKRDGLQNFNAGDYVTAAGSFKAAARQDPTDYQTQYYLGLSSERTGDVQEAIAAYRLCLKLRVQTPAGRQDIAMREKATARLAAVIATASVADPEVDAIQKEAAAERSSEDYRIAARVCALRGDADSAVDDYRHGMAIADDDFVLTKEFGLYLVKVNQTTEAGSVLKKAWKLNPSDRQVVEALRGLGITDSQLITSPVRVEEVAMPVTGKSAWDMDVAPRD
jgi:Flp pilus assembly protein TadD